MDFLTRFKGRTNFLTKQGPNDLMSEASTPVLKVHSQPNPSSTMSGKKPRANLQKPLYYTEASFSPKRHEVVLTEGNSNSPMKGGMFMRNHQHYRKPSSQNNLHIETEPNFYEQHERRQYWAPPARHDFYTPQHAYMAHHEPENMEDYTFSHKVNNMRLPQPPKLMHYNSARIPQNNEMIDSPQLKPKNGSNLIPRRSQLNNNPKANLLRPGFKFNGDLTPEGHENRVNKMGFVERQNKVLNKYRPNLQVQTDSYSQKYLNRSVDNKYSAHSAGIRY